MARGPAVNEHEVSFPSHGNVLKLDDGDADTLLVYPNSLTCTLKTCIS